MSVTPIVPSAILVHFRVCSSPFRPAIEPPSSLSSIRRGPLITLPVIYRQRHEEGRSAAAPDSRIDGHAPNRYKYIDLLSIYRPAFPFLFSTRPDTPRARLLTFSFRCQLDWTHAPGTPNDRSTSPGIELASRNRDIGSCKMEFQMIVFKPPQRVETEIGFSPRLRGSGWG